MSDKSIQNVNIAEESGGSIFSRPWWTTSFSIWGYITQSLIGPLVMSMIVIMFVFLLQFLMRFIDKIVGKGLDFWTIVQVIAFNLAWMVVLAVPMAVLVASVMAFGSLSSTNEMTAMKAAGVSLGRMLFPVLTLGLLIGVFDLQFNNLVLPDANHKAKDLMSDIQRKRPTLMVQPGQFTDENDIPGYSILARRTIPKSNDLGDVTIYDHSTPSETRVLTAKRASLAFTRDFKNIILTLRNGELHQYSVLTPADYRRGHFDTYVVHVPTNGFDFMRQGESERSGRELSAQALLHYVHGRDTIRDRYVQNLKQHLRTFAEQVTSPISLVAGPTPPKPLAAQQAEFSSQFLTVQSDLTSIQQVQEDIDSYMVEVHKKYSIPVACIVFVLLGAPMGALARRGGVGVGVGLSIGFFVLYWIFLIGGEKLADRGVISPFWGMWGGNILLGALGIYLTWRVSREAPKLPIRKWVRDMFVTRFQRTKGVAIEGIS